MSLYVCVRPRWSLGSVPLFRAPGASPGPVWSDVCISALCLLCLNCLGTEYATAPNACAVTFYTSHAYTCHFCHVSGRTTNKECGVILKTLTEDVLWPPVREWGYCQDRCCPLPGWVITTLQTSQCRNKLNTVVIGSANSQCAPEFGCLMWVVLPALTKAL